MLDPGFRVLISRPAETDIRVSPGRIRETPEERISKEGRKIGRREGW
jgi:hypothetical protein